MRTATSETVRAVRRAIGQMPYSRWAKERGLLPVTVRAALKHAPMSATRENTIRAALGLPLIQYQLVNALPGQYLVNETPKRFGYRRRSFWVAESEVNDLDIEARQRGYSCAGAWGLAAIQRERAAARVPEFDYTVCNSG